MKIPSNQQKKSMIKRDIDSVSCPVRNVPDRTFF